MNWTKVRKDAVRPIVEATFPRYRGRTFKVGFTDTVSFHDTNWGGGSRNTYRAVRMDKGTVNDLPSFAPWSNPVEGQTVDLPENVVVVEHSIFCGKDMGLRFYAHPNRSRMLVN